MSNSWVILVGFDFDPATEIIGPFNTENEATQAAYDLGIDDEWWVIRLQSRDEYAESQVRSS